MLPEAVRNERKKVLIFWSIMYEVCQTFCVWKKFCNSFCELFNMEDEPRFDMDFFKATKNSRQTLWLYDTATKICESDLLCVERCLKMELHSEDYDQTLRSKETTENVFKALYDMARKYFIKCAEQNDKPPENVELLTIDDFCKEATNGWSEYIQKCINSLARWRFTYVVSPLQVRSTKYFRRREGVWVGKFSNSISKQLSTRVRAKSKFFFVLPTENIGPWTPYISHGSTVENVTIFYVLNTTVGRFLFCIFSQCSTTRNSLKLLWYIYRWIILFLKKKFHCTFEISKQNGCSKFLNRHNSAKNCSKIIKKIFGLLLIS